MRTFIVVMLLALGLVTAMPGTLLVVAHFSGNVFVEALAPIEKTEFLGTGAVMLVLGFLSMIIATAIGTNK